MATVGCDPEVAAFDVRRGRFISGETLLNDEIRTDYGTVGVDGTGDPLELRPNPSSDLRRVVYNIAKLLRELKEFSGIEFYIGSYAPEPVGPLGGHIHIWGRYSSQYRVHNDHRIQIAAGLSYLWRLENAVTGKKRRRRGYGRMWDIRKSRPSVEFRSPSSDWLAHPTLALHVLQFAQYLADHASSTYCGWGDPLIRDLENVWWYRRTDPSEPSIREKIFEYTGKMISTMPHRKEDVSVIDFFARNLSRLRDRRRLIKLNIERWEKVCAG